MSPARNPRFHFLCAALVANHAALEHVHHVAIKARRALDAGSESDCAECLSCLGVCVHGVAPVCLFWYAPIIALAISSVNHFPCNPLENNPADVLGESDRVSLGPFAHTLRRLFGQRGAVVALFKLAESAGDEVAVEAHGLA